MNVLHFCSYYVGSKVYFELFKAISNVYSQQAYIPVRSEEHLLSKQVPGVDFYFVKKLNALTRICYLYKLISVVFPALKNYLENNVTDFVHAHTLYSDGIPAYLFSRVRNQKLVVTVRNTDVNLGFKYYRHYKWLVRKVLVYSSKIIFISPAHKKQFQNYFGHTYDGKLFVIPNGVDEFFIDNSKHSKSKEGGGVVALHIAAIDKNKNLKNTILAYFMAIKEHEKAEFRVAGGTYSDYKKVFGDLPEHLKGKVVFLGKLDKEQLIKHMSESSIFIMVSHKETFGLVYVEAISQCLPIVYTSGQGVDGYFSDGVYGFKANSRSVESISTAIQNTLNKFPNGLGPFEENPAASFSWDKIAKVYMEEVYK
ncbi:glycosyltransferase family 4 protein [Pseudoalteromonas sp. PAB 2.2]|uniref:glycosyltransferase family 4 protein n=1 Tax=Pseudoalteromonas sp. PAB 2.2 TaxID=1841508 RepID=UPI00094F8088|nr:glycosyltransferase family 4 protein [Pseudoalteromonas sp. PAB 2.2]